jgi:hypothetical protein
VAGVSAERVKLAKTIGLLAYLQANEPGELRKCGPDEYRTVTHGSLVISNGLWYWHRGGFGGRSALDYLIKVRGMGFVEAVEAALGGCSAPALSLLPVKNPKPLERKLVLPEPVKFPQKAVKYLQGRGIHSDVISHCLKSGILYEGIYKNPKDKEYDGTAVCVFVGRDGDGKGRFAALRGIGTDLKKDAAGSDKRFGFNLPAEDKGNKVLAVFEAPIDLLSHATMAMRGDLEFGGHRLSLGGTADLALTAFLERNSIIECVALCLDNDEAGKAASDKIIRMLAADERYSNISATVEIPKTGKDYNDALLHAIKTGREQKHGSLSHGAVFSL